MAATRSLILFALIGSALGQRTSMRYSDWFAVRPRTMLMARTVFKLTGANSDQCAMECLSMRGRCLSFDYHRQTRSCFGRANGDEVLRSNSDPSIRGNDNYDFYVTSLERVHAAVRNYQVSRDRDRERPPPARRPEPPRRQRVNRPPTGVFQDQRSQEKTTVIDQDDRLQQRLCREQQQELQQQQEQQQQEDQQQQEQQQQDQQQQRNHTRQQEDNVDRQDHKPYAIIHAQSQQDTQIQKQEYLQHKELQLKDTLLDRNIEHVDQQPKHIFQQDRHQHFGQRHEDKEGQQLGLELYHITLAPEHVQQSNQGQNVLSTRDQRQKEVQQQSHKFLQENESVRRSQQRQDTPHLEKLVKKALESKLG
uniref:Apple domain-containing protein n=1 Tax=Ciona intestinalis TaxID=7719 RepID=F6YSE9_CIOIN|nr:putative uncharacterized protein DDB_G0268364 [Ciona intestinalis]|eukprot:XP_002124001.1 putative uncharacterized protein DDB_G0268364 [Ciona intestinalis]